MSNEFGEDIAFYIWPTDHEDGTEYPKDFYSKVRAALRAGGFDCETV